MLWLLAALVSAGFAVSSLLKFTLWGWVFGCVFGVGAFAAGTHAWKYLKDKGIF